MGDGTTYLALGQWKVVCDRCGFEYKSNALRREWTGLRVCTKCFEPRHPQEMLKGRADKQAPPWVRPEPPDIEVHPGSGNEITPADV